MKNVVQRFQSPLPVYRYALVNLAGNILLYGALKCIAVFVAKMFLDLSPSSLNSFSKWKFSTFLYFWNCVLKPANNLRVTKRRFLFDSFCTKVRQKFKAVSREKKSFSNPQTHSRDEGNILLTCWSANFKITFLKLWSLKLVRNKRVRNEV